MEFAVLAQQVSELVKELKGTKSNTPGLDVTRPEVKVRTAAESRKELEDFSPPPGWFKILMTGDRPVRERLGIGKSSWDLLSFEGKQWTRTYCRSIENGFRMTMIVIVLIGLFFPPVLPATPQGPLPALEERTAITFLRITNIVSIISLTVSVVLLLYIALISTAVKHTFPDPEMVSNEQRERNEILDNIISQKVLYIFGWPMVSGLAALNTILLLLGYVVLGLTMLVDPWRWSIARFFLRLPAFF
jgi:hypothetical protein